MLTIVHGEDIVLSRKKLDEIIQDNEWSERFDAKGFSKSALLDSLSSQDLFVEKKFILLENFSKISKNDKDALIPELAKIVHKTEITCVVWNEGKIDSRLLNKLDTAHIYCYELPKCYFAFLDTLAPFKSKELIRLHRQLQDTSSAEQLFYSIIKRVRLLHAVKNNAIIDDTATLSPWQLQKLQRQAAVWDKMRLQQFYNKLFDIEVGMKSGGLATSLDHLLDILFVSELN